MDKKIRLYKSWATQLRYQQNENEEETRAKKCDEYRDVVGSLLGLANGSRPDIFLKTNQVANFAVTLVSLTGMLKEYLTPSVVNSRLWYSVVCG